MKRKLKSKCYIPGFVILVLMIHVNCSEKKKIQSELEVIYDNSFNLSLDKMECRHSVIDTVWATVNAKWNYTFVQYVDSAQCSPCTLNKMYQWNGYIERFHKKGVRFVFIFEPGKALLEDVYLSIESSGLKNPIYVDTANVFRDNNRFLPSDLKFHSFLLDKNGKVLVVGNPLHNKKVEKLMDKLFSDGGL